MSSSSTCSSSHLLYILPSRPYEDTLTSRAKNIFPLSSPHYYWMECFMQLMCPCKVKWNSPSNGCYFFGGDMLHYRMRPSLHSNVSLIFMLALQFNFHYEHLRFSIHVWDLVGSSTRLVLTYKQVAREWVEEMSCLMVNEKSQTISNKNIHSFIQYLYLRFFFPFLKCKCMPFSWMPEKYNQRQIAVWISVWERRGRERKEKKT